MNKSDVFYQIYPLSFNDGNGDGYGDLQGIFNKIEYLKKLGVNWVWISSHWDSSMHDLGYDVKDYLSVNPIFGNMDNFKSLISEFHSNGIRLITDAVFNHTSIEHNWFKEALKNNQHYKGYYFWTDHPNLTLKNVTGELSYSYVKKLSSYYLHMFNKYQADLNWSNLNLRNEIYSIINKWIDLGIDGFRFDVLDMIAKEPEQGIVVNGSNLHEYIKEMNHFTFGKIKNFFTVGECWSAGLKEIEMYTNPINDEITSVFALSLFTNDFSDQGQWKLNKFDLDILRKKLERYQNAKNVKIANVLSNHDIPRFVSRVFLNDCFFFWSNISKMMMGILLTLNGYPFIYQGEEIGMLGIDLNKEFKYKDSETLTRLLTLSKNDKQYFEKIYNIKRGSRDNSRTMMQWNEKQITKKYWIGVSDNIKEINVDKQENDKNSVLNWTKKMITFRKNKKYCDALCEGEYENLEFEDNKLFGYIKKDKNSNISIFIISNWSNKKKIILNNDDDIIMSNGYNFDSNELEPYGIIIFLKNE